MTPLDHILRKYTTEYKYTVMLHHLIYMDDKLFTKNEQESETLIQTVII